MTKMTEQELLALTDQEMRQAVGYWSGKLANQRQKSLAYYLGEAKYDLAPAEVEGRSSVVAPVVRNTIESMLPQLMIKFVGSEHCVEFEPVKPGDEGKAEQATDYCNHIFYVVNRGERIAHDWMKDALLSKNGIIKVWWDTRAEETREEYRGLSDIELSQLMDDEEIEVTEQKAYPDEEDAEQRQAAIAQLTAQLQQAAAGAQMGDPQAMQAAQQLQGQLQQIMSMPPKMLFDVVCKRSKDGGRVRVENVPPEEFLISRKAKTIEDAPFVGHRVLRTASELKSMGYKNIDNISSDDSAASLNMERVERWTYDDEMAYSNTDINLTADQSQRQIWVTECYVRVDYDGDGISELRKVVRAGNQMLENEIVDVAPFVSITPVPMPHKFFGLSVADLALESQRTQTMILRGVLDNMYLQINGRYFAVNDQVNLDDLLTSRPGGVVRMNQPGMAGRLDQGMSDSQLGLSMLEYMKGFNEDSTGWTRYNQGADGDSLNATATGVNLVVNRADLRLDMIARNFADGYRKLFKLILRLCSQYQTREDVIRLRGEWVAINPREWRNGFEVTLNVGLGTGSKDQQVAHLVTLLQQQQAGLQIGTADPANVYAAQSELAKLLGFRSPDKYFSDPSKKPPQPPQPGPAEIEQMKLQAQVEAAAQKNELDRQLERERMSLQAEVDSNRQRAEAEQQAAKIAYEKDLEQFKAEKHKELEQFKAILERDTKIALAKIQAETDLIKAQVTSGALVTAEQDQAADNVLADDIGGMPEGM